MLLPLDGPSKQLKVNVTDSAAVLVKADTNPLEERKIVTLQPLSIAIKVYFANTGETPSAATVLANGFDHPKKALRSYEASDKQDIYIVAISGSTDVVIAERA